MDLCWGPKQFRFVVVRECFEPNVKAGRLDRRARACAKDWRTQLGANYAISAGGFVCGFGSGLHPSVTGKRS